MQVRQAGQAWHPSLMPGFVGYGSIREPYLPAAKHRFYVNIRGCKTLILHLHPWRQELHTHTQRHTHTGTYSREVLFWFGKKSCGSKSGNPKTRRPNISMSGTKTRQIADDASKNMPILCCKP